MEFLVPTMLWGVLAAGVPVVLHLIGRSKPQIHLFPALRFIIKSQQSSSRALRIKNILLLILRILALLLMALAFARPLWPEAIAKTFSYGAGGGQIRGNYILILDNSMSMSVKEGDKTRFDRAREQMQQLIARLAPESRAALIVASEKARRVQSRLTLNHALVRQAIAEAEVSGETLRLDRALNAAEEMLARESGAALACHLLFFTDLQANAYTQLSGSGLLKRDSNLPTENRRLYIVNTAQTAPTNGAILSLELPSRMAGVNAEISLNVRIRPVDATRTFPVSLYVDETKVQEQPVDAAGRSEVTVNFKISAGQSGPHAGFVRLDQSDVMSLDQERYFSFETGKAPGLLLVEQRMESDKDDSGTGFYLRSALEPPASVSATGMKVTVRQANRLLASELKNYRTIVLADPGPLGNEIWKALENFVHEGGGLMVWAGPRTPVAAWEKNAYSDFARHRGLLPCSFERWVKLPEANPLGLKLLQPNHPVMTRFTPSVLSILDKARIFGHLALKAPPDAANAQTILALGTGQPLMLEKVYGKGRVLFLGIGADRESSSLQGLGEAEAFLTLVLESVKMLSGISDEGDLLVGQAPAIVLFEPPSDRVVAWQPPGNRPRQTLLLDFHNPEASHAVLHLPPLREVGIHRLSWRGKQGDFTNLRFLAVNVDTQESDLTIATNEQLESALHPWKIERFDSLEESGLLFGRNSADREFPVFLLAIVLLVVLAESLLSNRFYRLADRDWKITS